MDDQRKIDFCELILRGKGAREAFKEAGFTPATKRLKEHDSDPLAPGPRGGGPASGDDLLEDDEVRLYLAIRRMELQERTKITGDRIEQEIAYIAFFDPGEIVLEDVRSERDIARLPEHIRRAIVGWKYNAFGQFEIKIGNKQAAQDALTKIYGLYQKDRDNEKDAAARLLESPFWRYVFALRERDGLSLPDAMLRARAEPEAVEEFAIKHGLLNAGEIVQE